jgi:hypothetical protein
VESKQVRESLRTLNELHLSIRLFNEAFAHMVFHWKVISLAGGILGGFGMIWLAQTNPPFAFIYSLAFVNCTVIYIFMFDRAFEIPAALDQLKLDVEGRFGLGATWRREVEMRILAVPPELGIKSGSFGRMERETTPVFVDFTFNQIVSLLLTF